VGDLRLLTITDNVDSGVPLPPNDLGHALTQSPFQQLAVIVEASSRSNNIGSTSSGRGRLRV